MVDTDTSQKVAHRPPALCRICGEEGILAVEPGEAAYCLAHLPTDRIARTTDPDTHEFIAGYRSLSEVDKAFVRGALAALTDRSEAAE